LSLRKTARKAAARRDNHVMPKSGKSLERLVASIERGLAGNGGIKIESPKRLRDSVTGRWREHDVVLTIAHAHHTVLVAIECRDRSRPVGVPAIEAFFTKCQHTGINQGVIVSPKGFCGTARDKAKHLGVRCLDLSEATSFDWLLAPGIQSIRRTLTHHSWRFVPEDAAAVGDDGELLMNGQPIQPPALGHFANRLLTEYLTANPSMASGKAKIRVPCSGVLIRNPKTGATTPATMAHVELTYEIKSELSPFALSRYQDADKNIADVASADVNLGNVTGKLVITYNSEGGQIVLATGPAGEQARKKKKKSRT
jgi:hypothetical protein